MRVEFLGHAGLLLESESTRLLMDPWFSKEGAFDASWFQLPANHHLATRDWSRLDGVIVSHEHMDHLDPTFLRALPEALPIYVTQYEGTTILPRKIQRTVGRRPTVLRSGREHRIGDFEIRTWTELSPMNQDSVWVFKQGGRSVVHTVDSRITQEQIDEILAWIGSAPDLLLVQGAGASWYPLAYQNYDDATKQTRGLKKREQKLSYAAWMAHQMKPKTLVVCAGPVAFLDDELRYANDDPSFPTPAESRTWIQQNGYAGRIEAPLPGDFIDLETEVLTPDAAMHATFAWEDTARYLETYAAEMRSYVEAVRRRADETVIPDLDAAVRAHFERMLSLSPYFNSRIWMTVCFDIEGPDGGAWLVDFGAEPRVRKSTGSDSFQYRYRFHSRWLKRILAGKVPWEDFLLSLRFSAHRDPDVYNDHLLGLMKFNDAPSLQAVERWERRENDEVIVVTSGEGVKYEIAKYCPHAGASMEKAPISGRTITCLNHHYVFDLDTGRCLTGNCTLRTRRLDPT